MNICTCIRGIPVPPKDNKVMIKILERYKLLKDNHSDVYIAGQSNESCLIRKELCIIKYKL